MLGPPTFSSPMYLSLLPNPIRLQSNKGVVQIFMVVLFWTIELSMV